MCKKPIRGSLRVQFPPAGGTVCEADHTRTNKEKTRQWRVRIRTTTKYRSEQRKSFRETGRTSLSFKSLLVYTLGLRMQDRGVYKEGCSMKKVCVSLFLIILLLAAIVPVSAAGTLR